MISVHHNIDGEKTTTFKTETEFMDFVKKIVIENEDYDFTIIGISDAIEYIENYCPNLTLLINE